MELFEQIKKEAKTFLLDSKGCHDWEHIQRVYNLSMRIGQKENANLEILGLSAILHDIGRDAETRSKGKICHACEGASMAGKILQKHNLNKDKIDRIVHCIECHRFRNNKIPASKEAKILFDADKLDSIGAIGIGRAFIFAGENGAKMHSKNIDIETTSAYTIEDTAYREFMVKLRKIKDMMFTAEGKKIAEERHKYMAIFFDRLHKEVDGIL